MCKCSSPFLILLSHRYVDEIKSNEALLATLDDETKLKLYSYGKQGKFGDCTDPEPSQDDHVEHAKWEGWTGLKGTSKEDAEKEFIAVAHKVLGY